MQTRTTDASCALGTGASGVLRGRNTQKQGHGLCMTDPPETTAPAESRPMTGQERTGQMLRMNRRLHEYTGVILELDCVTVVQTHQRRRRLVPRAQEQDFERVVHCSMTSDIS